MSQTRYQILGTIGVGASSRVDKARDTLIDRTVVLKTFANGFASPDLQKQFLREAQILGRLSHPNIISIYDIGTNDDGSAYLVTEYVPGKTLDAALAEKGAKVLDHGNTGLGAGAVCDLLDHVDRKCVGYFDRIGITATAAGLGVVLAGDVLGKFSFSRCAVAFSAACAKGALAVSDDPEPLPVLRLLELEPWAFAGTRHVVFISSMLASVV